MPKRRKILFVNHVASVSGAEASLLDMLGGLDRTAVDPVVLLPEPGRLSELLGDIGIRTVFMPMRRFRKTGNPLVILSHLGNVLGGARRLARLIRRERIDLVHANSNNAQIYAGLAARWAGVPCVWQCRDLVELGLLGKWMAAHATRILAISDAVKRHLRLYAPAERLMTIHNGIDASAFERGCDGAAVRREWGITENAFLVGMAGQTVRWKNHERFLAAAAKIAKAIPEARFLIAGANLFDPDSDYEASLRTLAKAYGLEDRLIFAGYRKDMNSVLASLDVLLHPADKEPLGRVILEAMALGRPVIAVDACGPAEIIHSGVDGFLVPPGDVEGMTTTAIALWRDRKMGARIGAAARAHIQSDFSTQGSVSKMETLYTTILGGRGARRPSRIAYVVAEFPSITETFILREMTALEQRGVDMRLFALRRPASEAIHPEAKRFLDRVHYRSSAISLSTISGLMFYLATKPFRVLPLLWKAAVRGDPDDGARLKALYHLLTAADYARVAGRSAVTHVHAHFAYTPADIGAMMARLLGVRFSVSAHAWDIYTRKREATAARLRDAAFVAICTEHGRDHLKTICPWLQGERLALIRHGIFPDRYPPANPVEPVILGVGRLEEKKGFRFLIEACRILKSGGVGFRCVIAGEGSFRHELANQIANAGLERDVILAGELTQDKLMNLYGTAMVLVVPSVTCPDGDRDGLPNVLLEAMAMRIPVVASSVSAIPEVVEEGVQGLLVPPGNAQKLADCIRLLLSDESLRKRMGGRGRETVCRDFDAARNVEKLADLLTGKSAG